MALLQDTRYALRNFRRNPSFVLVATLSIALGIAANTTIFSVANAALFGDMPVPEPDRLITLNNDKRGTSFSQPDWKDIDQQSAAVLEGVAAHFPLAPASISGGSGVPERIWGQMVSGNYFPVLRVAMALGRGFRPEEDQVVGRDQVVVLTHGLWQRRFAGDAAILGRTISLNGRGFTVVGVTVPGFHGTERGLLPDFFVPLSMANLLAPEIVRENMTGQRDAQWLTLDARLKPGATRESALAALNVINSQLDETYRKSDSRSHMLVEPSGSLPGGARTSVMQVMAALMIVVSLVLTIACANVANLLLARATDRQKEIAVRLAVGASRGRLIRQLLTESVLLSLFGAVGGLAITFLATQLLGSLELPIPLPVALDFSPDVRVFSFTATLAVITGILFGLAPAIRATRPDLITAIKEEASPIGSLRRFGLRNALVVAQVALSLVLLVGSGLFLRSLQHASQINIGMQSDNILMVSVDPRLHNYSTEKSRQFYEQFQQRILALPGVQSIGYTDVLPLSIGGVTLSVRNEAGKDGKDDVSADLFTVGGDYFQTLGIPLRQGRVFRREDAKAERVAVIDEALARKLYPGQSAVGRILREGKNSYEVVGVVANIKSRTIGEGNRPCFYRSMWQDEGMGVSFFGTSMLVKTANNPTSYLRAVREQVAALDRDLPLFNVDTMTEHVSKAMLLPRLAGALFGIFGGVGLTLAMVGLYGVMSFAVRRRTKEIGIRIALGARTDGVLRMIASQGLALTGVGVAVGLLMSLAVTRFVASVLYGVSATDLVTFVGVPLVLFVVALVAVLVPARRAAKVDPLIALRYE